ncbi:AEC family transporter [Brevundimonas intermedia]|uniref:AEC family transporter n=1 Tax=Brevundimonas intermedia TaxID=74315 RepID=UPI00285289A9|nr:AEC family transporter [Brevundimonas intermedia]
MGLTALIAGVLPVFLMIALGYGLRKSGFLPDEAWRPIEKLSINIFYPSFLIPAIWHADLAGGGATVAGAAAVGATLIVAAATLAAKPLITLDGPAYTSVFQGVIRWNSFVFVPVIQSVYGSEGTALAAVAIAFIIPVTNIACVAVLAKWGSLRREPSALGLAKSMLANPILLACLIGLALNLLGVPLIPGLSDALDLLGAAALPLGLIVAGAGLSFAEVKRSRTTIAAVTLVKLGVMPPLMWVIAWALGGDSLAQGIALICGAAPGSAASYILARQMGGDAPLIAGVIALTTVGSAVVIPILLMLFHFT